MAETVKVVVRCRPLFGREIDAGRQVIVGVDSKKGEIKVKNPKADKSEASKVFTFDQVWPDQTRQIDLFNATAKPIVHSSIEGYNGTIFAYGQTGTGKTHTMEGKYPDPELQGIIPNCFDEVFSKIEKMDSNMNFLVRASFLEIYNEDIRDLLAKNQQTKLELKETPETGVYVKNLTSFVVKGVTEIRNVLEVGKKNRTVGATLMNQDSSRSHSIFTITIETSEGEGDDASLRMGKLNLVDLAGSERQSKTGATGDRLKEATKINMSLSALGNVISALVDGKTGHIPYRDSKLTRLLQDSLGGNTKTVMVANIGPADINFDETITTLRYANRAKNIKNKPKINEDPKDAMLREFQNEIELLKKQLGEGKGGGGKKVVEKKVVMGASEARLDEIKEEMRQQMLSELKDNMDQETTKLIKENAEKAAMAQYDEMMGDVKQTEEEKKQIKAAMKALAKENNEQFALIEKERQEQQELENKLQAMKAKIVVGNVNLVDKEAEQDRELEEQQRLLQEQKAKEEADQKRISELEEMQLIANDMYNTIEDEIEMKTKKLKKLFSKWQTNRIEIDDLNGEFQQEREDMLDTIRNLTQQIKLKNLQIDAFIPAAELDKIVERAVWDEATGQWILDGLQYAGNNMRVRRTTQGDADAQGGLDDQQDRVKAALSAAFGEEGEHIFAASDSEKLSNVFFSYKDLKEGEAQGAPGAGGAEAQASGSRPQSARRRPGSASRPKSGRPGTAKREKDKGKIGSLKDEVANLDDGKASQFPTARGLSARRR